MAKLVIAIFVLFLFILPVSTNADIVDRIRFPGDTGFPALPLATLFSLWIDGEYTNLQAIQAANQLCHCEITVSEQGQFGILKDFVTSPPTITDTLTPGFRQVLAKMARNEKLQELVNRMVALQEGIFPVNRFRTIYGLPV